MAHCSLPSPVKIIMPATVRSTDYSLLKPDVRFFHVTQLFAFPAPCLFLTVVRFPLLQMLYEGWLWLVSFLANFWNLYVNDYEKSQRILQYSSRGLRSASGNTISEDIKARVQITRISWDSMDPICQEQMYIRAYLCFPSSLYLKCISRADIFLLWQKN